MRAAIAAAELSSQLQGSLEGCSEVTAEVVAELLEGLRTLTGASGVYLAERLGEPAAEGEEAGKACVRYLASSAGSESVLGARVGEGQGVLWPTWVMPPAPEVEEEAEAEEGAEAAPRKPPPPPPTLPPAHVRNVLKDRRIVHHGIPRPGAFYAQPIQYGTPLHAEAVPPASAEEEAQPPEEEEEAPPAEGEAEPTEEERAARAAAKAAARAEAAAARLAAGPTPVTVPRSLALCLDTCGQNRDFTPEQLAAVKAAAGWLKAALQRTEAARFKEEYFAQLKPKDAAEEEGIRNEDKAAAEAVEKGEWGQAAAVSHVCVHPSHSSHPPPPTHTSTPPSC